MKNRHITAFTLAEILITLGIIGIVAVLTIPSLIQKHENHLLKSQYAKSQTILANGYKLMMAINEVFDTENIPFMQCNNTSCISKEHKKFFKLANDTNNGLIINNLPKNYAILEKNDSSQFDWSKTEYIFMTNDGFVYGITRSNDKKTFDITVDINGAKTPNIVKRDLYKYRISDKGILTDISDELAEIKKCSKEHNELCTSATICEKAGGRWCGFDKKSCIWNPNLACWD